MPVPVSEGRVREGGAVENGIKDGKGGVVDEAEEEEEDEEKGSMSFLVPKSVPMLLFC